MDTRDQLLLRKHLDHTHQCAVCRHSDGLREEMCATGIAIIAAYGDGRLNVDCGPMAEIKKLTWGALAMATLRAEDDPDETWVMCLDAVIAEKVEYIWAMSEFHWKEKTRHGCVTR